ncbi:flagellar biosynthesis protein FlhA [Sansalvadorimonas sp. 2012CJ34-2]|uniref:Flagellar biosynthesis protein FlhA n=1 Tax=Parendozoicomonas callyspongiae TaxID=2942213 RepID=A0ABT0PDV1_9GAMM|nr:flagellar biosynthesis protein FlhA [Sansalvadorimonas sp. 2012CJ34-2]MCL6269532.1 flagellar biosynthesis protein FlhA [Sansalvadorimonas sp. 2012CJ34-2]
MADQATQTLRTALSNYLAPPLLLLVALAMIILRIPPFFLDVLFTFNIALSLVLLLQAIYIKKPLEFTVFPTLLLISTLLRLALNIASTRIVLLQGHNGGAAAGKVIESFGEVVIAGDYIVGLVVFIILIIVNFVVITKGCTRISEVTARFTLDAMPGKQMAIDADLNAGLVNQDEARERRREVGQEADFYGAMDGASKFVRGDAVAGLLILTINLLGGLGVGILQHDMPASAAFHTYSLLTIGDGLVAQIPALLLSTTAAIIVTRVSGMHDMQHQIRAELLAYPKTILVTAGLLIAIGLVPGMPHLAFAGIGTLILGMALFSMSQAKQKQLEQPAEQEPVQPTTLAWHDLPAVDPIGLEIGYRLIPLVDESSGGELTRRIRETRKELSQELGFLLPAVHIRDNMNLDPEAYMVTLQSVDREGFQIQMGKSLAIKTDNNLREISGTETLEPAYRLKAYWIDDNERDHATRLGYTVVDPVTIITTHLGRIMKDQASELFGYDETRQWLEQLRPESARLCDELVPDKLSLGQLMKVCQQLLKDQVPLSDRKTIVTRLLDFQPQTQPSSIQMAEHVRIALRYQILAPLTSRQKPDDPFLLKVFTLSSELEKILLQSSEQARQTGSYSEDAFPVEPNLTVKLQQNLPVVLDRSNNLNIPAILLVTPQLRPMLSRFARLSAVRELTVLGLTEIPDEYRIEIIGQLG